MKWNPLHALMPHNPADLSYTPRYCRTRGCNLRHGHDGRCAGPHRQPIGVQLPRLGHGKGTSVGRVGPVRAPRHVTRPEARERMARYRSHTPQKFTVR